MKSFLDQWLGVIMWSGLGLGAFIASVMLIFAVYQVFTVTLGVPGIIVWLVAAFVTFTFLGAVYLRWFAD